MPRSEEYPDRIRAGILRSSGVYERIESDVTRRAALGVEDETPLYSLTPGGSPAFPSGDVMIRFGEGTEAAARQAEIESAGYRIERILPYAVQAAIVRAASGLLGDTLAGVARLARIPGVENVEPQMISERAKR
ncbi:MAG TPA: hypothetical protein VMG08_08270 [Allosphingosinicella sp.]|nr:hypothetical protein [Allosphingosinicella sp.]